MSEIDTSVVRYRYQKRDGTPVWIAFDPEIACVYCERPVREMSMGGPLVCGTCDCGVNFETGKKWTGTEAFNIFYPRANRNIDALPHDPAWEIYERMYRNRSSTSALDDESNPAAVMA